MWGASMAYRNVTRIERRLLESLLEAVPELALDAQWVDAVLVKPLENAVIGSLELYHTSGYCSDGTKLRVAAEMQFTDVDGVPVLVSLYVDAQDAPRELEIWKVNYQAVIEIPAELPKAQRGLGTGSG